MLSKYSKINIYAAFLSNLVETTGAPNEQISKKSFEGYF